MVIFFIGLQKQITAQHSLTSKWLEFPQHPLTSVVQKAEQLVKIYSVMLSTGYKIVHCEKNKIFSLILEIHLTVCLFILSSPTH